MVLVAVPPEMISTPLLSTVVLVTVPLEYTRSTPPLLTVVLTAEPPEDTASMPPLLTVKLTAVPSMIQVSPLLTVMPLEVIPEGTVKSVMQQLPLPL